MERLDGGLALPLSRIHAIEGGDRFTRRRGGAEVWGQGSEGKPGRSVVLRDDPGQG
jgi:hypothetical protein